MARPVEVGRVASRPVKAGEPLFTLENDKAAQDVESTESGILRVPPNAPKAGATVSVASRVVPSSSPATVRKSSWLKSWRERLT